MAASATASSYRTSDRASAANRVQRLDHRPDRPIEPEDRRVRRARRRGHAKLNVRRSRRSHVRMVCARAHSRRGDTATERGTLRPMGSSDSNVWHRVHAQREDGVAAMFLIRDVEPRPDQPKIFVVELPYPVTDLSGQPDAAAYRRLSAFQEQWLEPACAALGWTFVAWKCEDGSFFLYLYGAGDPHALLEKLAPFDGELGFFNDLDADWSEYATLRELVEQAEADDEIGEDEERAHGNGHVHTDDCDHDHDGVHDLDVTAHGIRVIDLTGVTGEPEPPAPPTPDDAIPSGNGGSDAALAWSEEGVASSSQVPRKPRRAASKPKRAATTAKRAAATAKRAAATAKRAAATAKRAAAVAKRATTKK